MAKQHDHITNAPSSSDDEASVDVLSGSETVGAALQSVRLKMGHTIEDATAGTKIKPAFLEALEAADYASLPAPSYVTGFVKIYAQWLGQNPADFAAAFKAELAAPDAILNQPAISAHPARRHHTPKIVTADKPAPSEGPSGMALGAIILVLVSAIWIASLLVRKDSEEAAPSDQGNLPKSIQSESGQLESEQPEPTIEPETIAEVAAENTGEDTAPNPENEPLADTPAPIEAATPTPELSPAIEATLPAVQTEAVSVTPTKAPAETIAEPVEEPVGKTDVAPTPDTTISPSAAPQTNALAPAEPETWPDPIAASPTPEQQDQLGQSQDLPNIPADIPAEITATDAPTNVATESAAPSNIKIIRGPNSQLGDRAGQQTSLSQAPAQAPAPAQTTPAELNSAITIDEEPAPEAAGPAEPVREPVLEPIVTSPTVARQRPPNYPAHCARRAAESEFVRLKIDLTREGLILNPRIAGSSNNCFNRAAVQAIRKWRFNPQQRDGRPEAASDITVKLTFDK